MKPTRSELFFAFFAIAMLMVLMPLESKIRGAGVDSLYRLYAGFVLSIIATTSFAIFVRLVRGMRKGTALRDIDPNVWTRPFSIILVGFLFLFGALVWWVSWEGKTGAWYGVGFFAGGLLAEAGLGRVIKSGW